MRTPQNPNLQKENPLQIGISALGEIEARLKTFRVMNQTSLKKRYLLSRADLSDAHGKVILKKSNEMDIPLVKLLLRYHSPNTIVKTFQPDEGIVIMSDMSTPDGISLAMDLVTQIVNIGSGSYEGFIERISSMGEFLNLLKKALFPRLIIIGYIPKQRLEVEKINFFRSRKLDRFIRTIEITHSLYKKEPYFPNVRHIHIDPDDAYAWGRLILEVIQNYTRAYSFEESNYI